MQKLKEKLKDNKMYFDPATKAEMYGDFLRGIRDSSKPRWLIIFFCLFVFILPTIFFIGNLWFIFSNPDRTPEDIFNGFGFLVFYLPFVIVGIKLISRR